MPHQVFVSVAQQVVAAGAIAAEVQPFEDGDQLGEPVHHFLALAQLWIHGHVHGSFSYSVGSTRVACNPRGYPLAGGGYENPAFDPGLLLNEP